MKRRSNARTQPPRSATRTALPRRTGHTTVPSSRPQQRKPPLRAAVKPAPTVRRKAATHPAPPPTRQVARIVDEQESSLLDLIDNLIDKGVMLNADLILALANVDLVYVRLSALLCAADRVMPRPRV